MTRLGFRAIMHLKIAAEWALELATETGLGGRRNATLALGLHLYGGPDLRGDLSTDQLVLVAKSVTGRGR